MASSSKKPVAVPPTAEILRPEEVSELLRTSLGWVYEKCRSRQRDPLPCLRIGRYIRFEKTAVLEWARNHGNTAAQKIAKAKQLATRRFDPDMNKRVLLIKRTA